MECLGALGLGFEGLGFGVHWWRVACAYVGEVGLEPAGPERDQQQALAPEPADVRPVGLGHHHRRPAHRRQPGRDHLVGAGSQCTLSRRPVSHGALGEACGGLVCQRPPARSSSRPTIVHAANIDCNQARWPESPARSSARPTAQGPAAPGLSGKTKHSLSLHSLSLRTTATALHTTQTACSRAAPCSPSAQSTVIRPPARSSSRPTIVHAANIDCNLITVRPEHRQQVAVDVRTERPGAAWRVVPARQR